MGNFNTTIEESVKGVIRPHTGEEDQEKWGEACIFRLCTWDVHDKQSSPKSISTSIRGIHQSQGPKQA